MINFLFEGIGSGFVHFLQKNNLKEYEIVLFTVCSNIKKNSGTVSLNSSWVKRHGKIVKHFF